MRYLKHKVNKGMEISLIENKVQYTYSSAYRRYNDELKTIVRTIREREKLIQMNGNYPKNRKGNKMLHRNHAPWCNNE